MPNCLSVRNTVRKPNRSPLLWSRGKSGVPGVHRPGHRRIPPSPQTVALRVTHNSLTQKHLAAITLLGYEPEILSRIRLIAVFQARQDTDTGARGPTQRRRERRSAQREVRGKGISLIIVEPSRFPKTHRAAGSRGGRGCGISCLRRRESRRKSCGNPRWDWGPGNR